MEPIIQPNEWELQKLIEQKSFSELSATEKAFVEQFIHQHEYQLRHELISSTQQDETKFEPKPLILPKENNRIVVPLYQAILAVAATILVMFFLKFPYSNISSLVSSEQVRYISVTDTIKEIEYVYDTIYEEVEKTKVVEKKVYVPQTEVQYVKVYENTDLHPSEVLNAPNNYQKPNLKSILNEVDGSESLAEETNSKLFKLTIHRD